MDKIWDWFYYSGYKNTLQKESEGKRQEDTVAEWQNKNRNDKDDTSMADVQKQKK